jgi:molybdopterin synthase catalytic subunit
LEAIKVMISEEALQVEDMMNHISNPAHGALSTFIGTVRDFNMGRKVIGISYDVHVELAENVLQGIALDCQKKWGQSLRVFVSHFMGRLEIGQASVMIGVSSIHRKEAIAASSYIIEALKTRAPIWKQEHYIDNSSDWVKGHALCQHA